MTEDNTTPDLDEQPDIEVPEMESYEIRTTRIYEQNISEEQVQAILQQSDADDVETAIEQALLQQEIQHIEPDQKLLAVDVQANGPPDN